MIPEAAQTLCWLSAGGAREWHCGDSSCHSSAGWSCAWLGWSAGLPFCCGAAGEQAKGWWASFSPQKLPSELRKNCYSCWLVHTGSVSLLPLVQCFYSGVFYPMHHMQGKYNDYFSEKDWCWTLHSRQLHSTNVHCLLNTAFLRNCSHLEKAPTNPVVLHFCSWIWSFSLQLNHIQFCTRK